MIAGAAINARITACNMDTITMGTPTANCMDLAPFRKKPNKSEDRITPRGWVFPNNANAILSKPYPLENAGHSL